MSSYCRTVQSDSSGGTPGRSAIVWTIRSNIQTPETARVISRVLPLSLPHWLEVHIQGSAYALNLLKVESEGQVGQACSYALLFAPLRYI